MLISQRTSYVIFISAIIGVFLSAACLQNNIFINHDVSWLMEAARRMLQGGTYSADFFENNPPMILYLSLPAVLLTKLFSLNSVVAMRLYVYFIAAVSLWVCYDLLKKIFRGRDEFFSRTMLIVIAINFLILPLSDLAQREHLALLLTMPYFLLAAYQLEGKTLAPPNAGMIGIMAGLGFAIKPYFLAPLILVELYYIYCRKNLFAWLRPDFQSIMLVMVVYVTVVFLVNPDYIFIILPFALRWCHLSERLPWLMMLSINSVYFTFAALIFYLIQRHINPYKKFMSVLVLAILGYLLSYMMQLNSYKYHIVPAASIAVILTSFLYVFLVIKGNPGRFLTFSLGLFVAALAVLEYHLSFFKELWLNYPLWVFSYIGIMFATALYFTSKKMLLSSNIKIFFGVVFTLVLSYIFLIGSRGLFSDRFAVSIIFTFALYYVVVSKLAERRSQTMLMASLGIVLYVLPISYLYVANSLNQKEWVPSLINFMQSHTVDEPVYFISTGNDAFPNVAYYGSGIPVSRFSSLWMLGSLVKEAHYVKDSDPVTRSEAKYFLAQMIADDLNSKKPNYVFVDVKKVKDNMYFIENVSGINFRETPFNFNYITYFSENRNFAAAWKPYRYVTTLHYRQTKKYVDVYKRES
jgi:hypothetical protein